MAAFMKIEGIVAPPPTLSQRTTGRGDTSGIIDVGDLPDGVTSGETDSSQHSDVAASLELSPAAEQTTQTTLRAPSTNPVGIEPNPTPKPRPTSNDSVPSVAAQTPEFASISVDPLPFPHPNPLDSAGSIDTRA